MSEADRFAAQNTPEPNSGCWLWTGSVGSNGYGKAFYRGRHGSAHRWSWLLHRGEITDGQCVLHRCDVKQCVNPDHLFVGTLADNTHDMERKGRQRGRFAVGHPDVRWNRGVAA